MTRNYNNNLNIILPDGGKEKLYEKLDNLNIKHSEGIRQILIAFYQDRCAITPPTREDDPLGRLFKNTKEN